MNKTFPDPPKHKSGWPWTEQTQPLPSSMPDGSPWPKFSIVTPSFNQAQYLEETIRSVLSQGYPNLEYIIIDGGSSDGSAEIIKKYEPWLTYWVSEPDQGQSDAINKGFEQSTGEIMAWINSDDYYLPGVFCKVAKAFSQNQTEWIAGICNFLHLNGQLIEKADKPFITYEEWLTHDLYAQPSVFWKRTLWVKTNRIDTKLQYSFDYELWLQFAQFQIEAFWIDQPLSVFRMHPESKTITSSVRFLKEDNYIRIHYLHLEESFLRKLRILYRWQVRKANLYLSKNNCKLPVYKKILLALINAPWFLFYRKFYYKVKVLIIDK